MALFSSTASCGNHRRTEHEKTWCASAWGTADIRYRPEFKHWRVKLPIKYNADKISLEQLVNLFNLAGFGVGVGEWRPEKDGQYGMFHVVTE